MSRKNHFAQSLAFPLQTAHLIPLDITWSTKESHVHSNEAKLLARSDLIFWASPTRTLFALILWNVGAKYCLERFDQLWLLRVIAVSVSTEMFELCRLRHYPAFFPLGLLCFMLRHYFHEKEEAFEDADFDRISNHFCFGLQMRNPQRSSCLKNYHPKGLNKQRRCATLSWDRIATPKLFYSWLCRLRMRMFRVLSVCENMQVWNPFKHLSTMARNQKHPEIATLSETPTLHPISPGSSIEVYRLRLFKRPKSFSCSKWAMKVALCRHCSVNFTPVGSVGFWLTRIWSPGFLPIGQCGQRNRDDPRPVVKRKRSPQGLGLWISILAWQRKNISVYASQEDHDWLQACSLVFFVVQPAE